MRQVLSTYDGDLWDPLWWPQERPVPMLVAWGLSGFLSRLCRGLRSCVEPVLEPEYSFPVLTWIWGDFWSLPSRVSPPLEWGHARALSFRAVAAVSFFPSSGSRDQWIFKMLSQRVYLSLKTIISFLSLSVVLYHLSQQWYAAATLTSKCSSCKL